MGARSGNQTLVFSVLLKLLTSTKEKLMSTSDLIKPPQPKTSPVVLTVEIKQQNKKIQNFMTPICQPFKTGNRWMLSKLKKRKIKRHRVLFFI